MIASTADLTVIATYWVKARAPVASAAFSIRWAVRCSSCSLDMERREIGRRDLSTVGSWLGFRINTHMAGFQVL